jgi:kumamolisin
MVRSGYVELAGSTRPAGPDIEAAGPADPSEAIRVSVILRRANPVDGRQRGHARLTRRQLEARHGARDDDVQKVNVFAALNTLSVVSVNHARRTVVLSGTVGQFASAFDTTIVNVIQRGNVFRTLRSPIRLPTALDGVVVAVLGLDNRPIAKPHMQVAQPQNVLGSFSLGQITSLYNFPSGLDGTGQTIAIIELGGGYQMGDLDTYFGQQGLATPSVSWVSVDGGSNAPGGGPTGPDGEVMLDIEVAGSVAPGANIVVYFAPNTDQAFVDAVSTAVHGGPSLSTVASISWGGPETWWSQMALSAMDQALADAVALGITVCVASGDNGSSDGTGGQAVDFPASSPNALGCGGTTLDSDGTSILSEVAWSGSGGGFSAIFPPPAWQNFGYSGRAVPDVAGDADPNTGYNVRVDGTDTVIGGTSAVAPLWAGLIALFNQYLGADGTGFLNFVVYGDPSAQATFDDITSGSNGAFSAQPGYDLVTGWGSPNGADLLNVLATLAFAQVQLSLS